MILKKVYTKHFPFKGYKAITIWPLVFIRNDCRGRYTNSTHRHELIHAKQQLELLLVFFPILYALEYLTKLIICGNHPRAYYSISFEQEAFQGEKNVQYIRERSNYSWIKYIFKLYKK